MSTYDLPHLNVVLNSINVLLLITGYVQIKKRHIKRHKRIMLGAFTASALFLVSYLVYHYTAGATKFTGEGWIRPVYFGILISHTILAILVLPPILLMLYRALRQEFLRHARLARWVFPVWLYVSATGIIIYALLYHLYS
jgi:putative membrane protein